jgi:uncharacterized Zn-binding protein involved in type VI secretion
MFGLGAVRLLDKVQSICEPLVPSGPVLTASRTTFVNSRGLARLLDKTVPGPIITGSKRRFCDSRPIVRRKDKVVCGKIMTSSKDTFIDD